MIEHLLLLSVEIYGMACTDTDLVFCGVFVLVNGLYCAISFLSS